MLIINIRVQRKGQPWGILIVASFCRDKCDKSETYMVKLKLCAHAPRLGLAAKNNSKVEQLTRNSNPI
jgi:hypothetical protein